MERERGYIKKAYDVFNWSPKGKEWGNGTYKLFEEVTVKNLKHQSVYSGS